MNWMTVLQGVVGAAATTWLWGCTLQIPDYTRMPWRNPLDEAQSLLVKDPSNVNYVLGRMELARAAIRLGSYTRARPPLLEIRERFDEKHDNVAAALSSERFKFYKGETYERAMAWCYLGYVEYLQANYNDARICFMNARSEDQKAVIGKATPKEYGEDFGLANYWLGRTYLRLGKEDMSRIALSALLRPIKRKNGEDELVGDKRQAQRYQKQRAEGEKWVREMFRQAGKPELYVQECVDLCGARGQIHDAPRKLPWASEARPVTAYTDSRCQFFTPQWQEQVNLTMTIEVGRCPHKRLAGLNNEYTVIARSFVRPKRVRVYIDGHCAGCAHEVLDLWEQADTQDRVVEKDAAQIAKGILKEVLSHVPYVGSVAGYWDVSGDTRHWASLPGRVFVYAGRVKPGTHSVCLRMYDVNGQLLPRWQNTYWGISVPSSGEACVLLNPCFDGDNQLPPDKRTKAMEAGAKPELQDMTFGMQ